MAMLNYIGAAGMDL